MYITLTRSLIGTGALVRRGRRIDYLQKNKKWNENIFEVVFELFDSYFLRQARLWACGRGDMSTPSFGSHINPISTRGADYAHSIYWCPHQILKATGAPVRDMCFVIRNIKKLFHETAEV